jgi:hypothetical protein
MWGFTTMQISLVMPRADPLQQMFAHLVWRKGTLGLSLGVAAMAARRSSRQHDAKGDRQCTVRYDNPRRR